MTQYEQYQKILNSQPENETYFETIIISHSKMTAPRYFVFDSVPLDAGGFTFIPANISATNAANSNDLDQQASFSIADDNNELDDELYRIPLNDKEDVIVAYGRYISTDLSSPVEYVEYTAKTVPQKEGAFTIQCGVPNLNSNQTGEVYSFDRFPMLRGAV